MCTLRRVFCMEIKILLLNCSHCLLQRFRLTSQNHFFNDWMISNYIVGRLTTYCFPTRKVLDFAPALTSVFIQKSAFISTLKYAAVVASSAKMADGTIRVIYRRYATCVRRQPMLIFNNSSAFLTGFALGRRVMSGSSNLFKNSWRRCILRPKIVKDVELLAFIWNNRARARPETALFRSINQLWHFRFHFQIEMFLNVCTYTPMPVTIYGWNW